MDVAAAYEKNRRALLRMVVCWLAVAMLIRCARTVLPRRIARLVGAVLFKAEAATGYLLLMNGAGGNGTSATMERLREAARRWHVGLGPSDGHLTLPMRVDALIARLRALRAVLRALRPAVPSIARQMALLSSSPRRGMLARRTGEGASHFCAPFAVPP